MADKTNKQYALELQEFNKFELEIKQVKKISRNKYNKIKNTIRVKI